MKIITQGQDRDAEQTNQELHQWKEKNHEKKGFQLKLRTCELMGKHDASPSHSKFPLLVIKKLLKGNPMPGEV